MSTNIDETSRTYNETNEGLETKIEDWLIKDKLTEVSDKFIKKQITMNELMELSTLSKNQLKLSINLY